MPGLGRGRLNAQLVDQVVEPREDTSVGGLGAAHPTPRGGLASNSVRKRAHGRLTYLHHWSSIGQREASGGT